MWNVETRESAWPELTTFSPEHILDEYDGLRLFTVRSQDGYLLLAYLCGEDEHVDRFLLVPTDEAIVTEIEQNKVPLRGALLERGWAWLFDRARDGTVTALGSVDPSALPDSALPRPHIRLHLGPEVLLRVRMIGEGLTEEHVPASVVKRTVENSSGAMKALVSHALSLAPSTGRPADYFRRYYDLPAVGFAFNSFEIAFGVPEPREQPELGEKETLERVRELLSKGLKWALADKAEEPEQTQEWSAIADALAKLAPPNSGVVEEVEVSGALTGNDGEAMRLTRSVTERVGNIRKRLAPDRRARTHEGYVREFDKDKFTFILRDAAGETIRTINFSENQYDDTLLAFDSNELVTVVAYAIPRAQIAELISITYSAPPDDGEASLV